MATVINTFPDRRSELLGRGLGTLVGSVIEARRRKEREERERASLSKAADIIKDMARGVGTLDESDVAEALFDANVNPERIVSSIEDIAKARIAKRQRLEDATLALAKEGRVEAAAGRGELRREEISQRAVTSDIGRTKAREERAQEGLLGAEERKEGRDIEAEGRAEIRADFEYARVLQEAVNQEREDSILEKLERVALRGVLENVGNSTPKELFNAIARADLPNAQRLDLIKQIPNLATAGEPADDLRELPIFDSSGPLGKLPVPDSIHRLSQPDQDAWFKDKGFKGITTQPVRIKPEEGLKEEALQALVDKGIIDETQMEKDLAGLIKVRGPDPVGRVSIVDTSDNSVTIVGGELLTPTTLGQMDERILSINDALLLFRRADLSNVGIDKILQAEVGGIALQIPIVGAIAESLGLNPEDVAEIQADRSVFFAVLDPLVQSFSPTGTRFNRASKTQIELAKRISNMVRFSSTPGGAEMSRAQIVDILTDIRNNLVAQRISGSSAPVNVPRVKWFFDDDEELQFKMLGG